MLILIQNIPQAKKSDTGSDFFVQHARMKNTVLT